MFDVDIITQVLSVHFFQVSARTGTSIAKQNEDRFASSIPTKPDEFEIPEAMLALACVAVSRRCAGFMREPNFRLLLGLLRSI